MIQFCHKTLNYGARRLLTNRSCNLLLYMCHFRAINFRSKQFLLTFPLKHEIEKLQWPSDFHQIFRRYTMENKQKETFLIAGLGNHDHPQTRHSVGMQLVDRLAQYLSISLEKNRYCLGFVGHKELCYINVVLLRPRQPMNINGSSVHKTAQKYHIPVSHVYLVHDEMEKKIGKIGLKEKGSAGGHNGVKSAIQSFRTDAIIRVRIGIDRPTSHSADVVGKYVLEKFHPSEKEGINEALNQGILRIAQHIGARTGLSTAQVFRALDKSDQPSDCADGHSSVNKSDSSEMT